MILVLSIEDAKSIIENEKSNIEILKNQTTKIQNINPNFNIFLFLGSVLFLKLTLDFVHIHFLN